MNKILIRLLTVGALLAGALPLMYAEAPKHEMRGAWVATVYGIDWPSVQGADAQTAERQKAELTTLMDTLQTAGLNAVFLQVRPMADALYRSDKEPWSSYLTGRRGTPPDAEWDPLAFAVEEAHARGMELHAWVNPLRFAASSASLPSTPADTRAIRNGWILKSGKAPAVYDPANESAVAHVVDVCRDILRRYDVDGLVFDDYFYPDRFPRQQGEPADKYGDLRRHYVNRTVAAVHAMVEKTKPWVRFGVAPAGVAGGNGKATARYNILPPIVGSDWMYDRIFCDPLAWLNEGTVDYVSPQLYWATDHATNPYEPLAQWWDRTARHFKRHCYPSHSLTNLASTPAHWREQGLQIDIDRRSVSPGSVLYSASSLTGKKAGGLASWLGNRQYLMPALMPPMDWKHARNPGKISDLALDGNILRWKGNDAGRYVVYALPDDLTAEDVAADAPDRNYLAAYIAGVTYIPEFELPGYLLEGYRYAVAPYDRYGNEWPATMLQHR